ncbi:MAG TPA: KUP/HAK/KT family potassium transporter [Acidimicrobiales bacterium]|nr:KUP/HAK/KT family potassium transporter [Acidimicrobiales bacterium]
MAAPATADSGTHGPDARTIGLSVGALGVVFGDIGTNPLFAMREAFEGHGYELAVFEDNVLGLLSLMFWSLILVICVKYLAFVMRADNRGEGGILALSALVTPKEPPVRGTRWVILLIGLMGAALLHGDGVITPAISVLAAVEGTTIAAPDLDAVVVPAAVAILVGLFMVQHRGTTAIGRVFGPVMVVWFTTIGVLGLVNVADRPGVLRAVNPGHAVSFFADNGFRGFLVLGAVILVVVGGEALYADMGHFGRRPIVLGWYALVLPSLLLVYFGQGALLIEEPEAIDNPFYRLAPEWGLYPLVVLATIATVIASQALISGAYSLTRQAVQLGYSPRVHHTSATEIGQIYIGAVNWVLMAACVGLVIGFRKSANLAAAYGFAVTTTMVVTTIVFYFVARERFGWSLRLVVPLCVLFLVVDLAFFGATLFKIPDGGWFPLVAAIVVFTLLTTWRTGRRLVRERLVRGGIQLADFVRDVAEDRPVRTPGAGAYLASTPGVTPPALFANLEYNDAVHETVLVVSVVAGEVPRVDPDNRTEMADLGAGFHQVTLRYGFMEDIDVPRALSLEAAPKLGVDLDSLPYFLGRESLRVTARPGMARWREHLFALMSRNATSAATYFGLPPEQTVELGLAVEL